VDLVADLTVINPFDFFVESSAEHFPFRYDDQLAFELAPYLRPEPAGPLLEAWIARLRQTLIQPDHPIGTTNFLVAVNQQVQRDIAYLVRMEPGVQTPEETLRLARGSCRDSGWLLVQVFRHLGLAARFVSGYLIQLVADQKPLDGPAGPTHDFTDLHAWAEVYIPGAGWVGLDPTSGLLAGEGHIPLACTAMPSSAAPVTGLADMADVDFSHAMEVSRLHEDPRVTKPYTDAQWAAMDRLGEQVDHQLQADDVRLTQGGEPTFVSIDDMEHPQWSTEALGEHKRALAGELAMKLLEAYAPQGLMHHGQGKWYPGEPLPRWALSLMWRTDGEPLWRRRDLLALEAKGAANSTIDLKGFALRLARGLGLPSACIIDAFEDISDALLKEQALPVNLDASKAGLKDSAERKRLARLLEAGLGQVAGLVIPLKPRLRARAQGVVGWRTSKWPLRRERLFLVPGDSPVGLRLPLASLPWVLPEEVEPEFPLDPFDPVAPLENAAKSPESVDGALPDPDPREVVHTALCLEVRDHQLHVFMPPLTVLEDWIALVQAIEACAIATGVAVKFEGYMPPRDARLSTLSVTPDPGVIEVNVQPSSSWAEVRDSVLRLYALARESRLGTEKFMLDGRHTGTGGGNHVTLGGATPADSPMLRRPDLLRSLITYWQRHPSLSYLFSGAFIGPTSQAPRVDEARTDSLYELQIAFQQMEHRLPKASTADQLWLVDRLLRHLLVDLTGNTHRAEFCIDKLYSPDSPTGRLGIVEFRAFEMPPHAQMSLLQTLLLRALVARFWKAPYTEPLVDWGTALHDRWMLPWAIEQDIADIVREMRAAGYEFETAWFAPFYEFRYPRYGTVTYEGVEIELRQAIEPWNVLGEEVSRGGTARYVDSSVERLQVRVRGLTDSRHVLTCNGRRVPLQSTGVPGQAVAGVRYRAWAPPSALHPTIKVQAPLVFDLVDTWSARSIGGCTYHVAHPGGRNYDTFPVNANEAEARRFARFQPHGHTPGLIHLAPEPVNPAFPWTLDLRWHAV
jgi:uncharacterized protein (DUF2126 family)